jgi:hypothetical protein
MIFVKVATANLSSHGMVTTASLIIIYKIIKIKDQKKCFLFQMSLHLSCHAKLYELLLSHIQ